MQLKLQWMSCACPVVISNFEVVYSIPIPVLIDTKLNKNFVTHSSSMPGTVMANGERHSRMTCVRP